MLTNKSKLNAKQLGSLSKPNQPSLLLIKGAKSGFAMVMALVIMTVMFILVGSLATTRQMWGFFSTKQLDKSNVELPARADSSNWLRLNRLSLFENKSIAGNVYLTLPEAAEVIYMQYSGYGVNPAPFPPLLPDYPDYDTNTVTLSLQTFYSPNSGESFFSLPQGAYDPYFGVPNSGKIYGAVFRREMDESIRQLRVGRFSPETTQLRAWNSIDAALVSDVVYRRMPVSAFTLYALPISDINNVVKIGYIQGLTNSFNANGYSVNQVGIGKIYVDGVVDFQSNNVVLGLPIVATRGFTNIGSVDLRFPAHLGSGNRVVNSTNYDHLSGRYLKYRGMLATSEDRPNRLISQFLVDTAPFYGKPFNQVISDHYFNNLGSTAVRLSLNTSSTSSLVQYVGGSAAMTPGEQALITSTNVWQVDHTNRTAVLSFPVGYFDGFTHLPSSIFFNFTGANAAAYSFILNVPSVGSLSANPANQKLTIVTPNPLNLTSAGFNADESGRGAMLVSPSIRVSGASGPTLKIGGTVVTTARSAERPLVGTNPAISVLHVGSLVLFVDPSQPANVGYSYILKPDPNYISGNSIPPSVLGTMDHRLRSEEIRIYTMFATTNGAILP